LHAGALELMGGAGPDQVTQEAALIRVTAREALQELRSVLGVLRSSPGQGVPDQAAVEQGEPFPDLTSLVEASVRAGQPVELHDDAGSLPAATARVVYRIAQEGLTNAGKHAPYASTTVTVRRAEEGSVIVSVHNEPTASAPMDLPGSGSGLVGLAERLRLVGGSIHSGSTAEGGWQLRAVIPPSGPRTTAASLTAEPRIEQPGPAR
jgi:signal transduction histidine kinase